MPDGLSRGRSPLPTTTVPLKGVGRGVCDPAPQTDDMYVDSLRGPEHEPVHASSGQHGVVPLSAFL